MPNAIVVKFTKRGSNLNVKDKTATNAVDQQFHSRNAGKFVKKLFEESKEFKKIVSRLNAAYMWHINNSLPYLDEGFRMINADKTEDYIQKMNEFKSEIQQAKNEFEPLYQESVQKDITRLGDLGKLSDYPTFDEIVRNYDIDIKFYPKATKEDYRFDVPESVKNQLDSMLEEAKIAGRKELFNRAVKVVTTLKEASEKTDKTRRHESSLENIKDLSEVMEVLNVHDDAEVRYLAKDLKEVVSGITIWDLRNSEHARGIVVDRCNKFLQSVGSGSFVFEMSNLVEDENYGHSAAPESTNELVDSLV